jgi:hypothetical protein
VAKFGSQDVAAMTNHHLLLLVFYSCWMFYLAGKLGAVRATQKNQKKWASMNDLTGNSS